MKQNTLSSSQQTLIFWILLALVPWMGLYERAAAAPYRLSSPVWEDSQGRPLPFQTRAEIEEFLMTAPVLEAKSVGTGVTGVKRLLLGRGETKVYACFRHVKVFKQSVRLESGIPKIGFRDDAIFEIAAYELAKLLEIPTIPPTVQRTYKKKKGTLQLWVDNCMMERQRANRKLKPPNPWMWSMQLQVIRLFDALIYNEDRNQENILIDPEWRLWMIDHTRAFRFFRAIPDPKSIRFCERTLLNRLSQLSDETIREALSSYLSGRQITSLLTRRTLLLEHIKNLITEKGEENVLYTIWDSPPLKEQGRHLAQSSNLK